MEIKTGASLSCIVLLLVNWHLVAAQSQKNVILEGLRDKVLGSTVAPEPRIIGGQRVYDRCQPPFDAMVALQLSSDNPSSRITYCSGVMLTPDLVITAAICVFPFLKQNPSLITAVVGEKSFTFQDLDQQNIPVSSFKIHMMYNVTSEDNNIALVRLSRPATLSKCVQPLARFSKSSGCYSAIMNCTVTGWGAWSASNIKMNSENPTYGHVRLLDEDVIRIVSPVLSLSPVAKGSLYAIPYENSNVQTCLFEWGGMVACQVNGAWKLRGVIARDNCFFQSGPIIVSSVDYQKSWLDLCLANYVTCPALV